MTARKIFIAGSTGAVGRTVVRLADKEGLDIVPHVRPKHRSEALHPRAAELELSDSETLDKALAGVSTVLQLIGTMRKRFASGDTYESSDIGTTKLLVEAAKRSGVDHFILLSSVGAGNPIGAYLQAKAKAEELVTTSGLVYTIFRPSTFVGEGHRAPPLMGALTKMLHLASYQPIQVEDLARAILHVARERTALCAVLEGQSLWQVVAQAKEG